MSTPPPLPEYRVSHQGTIRGPFPLLFLEAMVHAGHFPRDVKVMLSTGGDWKALSEELGENTKSQSSRSRVPDSKTVLTWIFSCAAIAGVVALVGAIIVSEISKKEEVKRKANLAAASTPAPTPRYTPPARPSSTPSSYNNFFANSLITPPASTPQVRRAIAANTLPAPVSTPPTSTIYTDSSGQTFRISNYDYQRLVQLKQKLKAEEAFLEQQKANVNEYGREIDRARRNLNRYSQSSVNSFNAKIQSYNDQRDNVQGSIDRFNRKVNEFNAELRRVGTPIR